jgi:hypothetical protein
MTDEGRPAKGRGKPGAVASASAEPSPVQRRWLLRGAAQPGGKLPLFDTDGREIPKATIRACLAAGWAEPWFANPVKPDWLVCKLTAEGYRAVGRKPPATG